MDRQSHNRKKYDLFQNYDGNVNAFVWAPSNDKLYFSAPSNGLTSLFELKLNIDKSGSIKQSIRQITTDEHDYSAIIGVGADGKIIVQRTDYNHAVEIFSVDPSTGKATQLTHVNDDLYKTISMSKVEKKIIKTTDGKDMVAWVIYPPNFDPNKNTQHYCTAREVHRAL